MGTASTNKVDLFLLISLLLGVNAKYRKGFKEETLGRRTQPHLVNFCDFWAFTDKITSHRNTRHWIHLRQNALEIMASQASTWKCPLGKQELCRSSGREASLQSKASKSPVPFEMILKLGVWLKSLRGKCEDVKDGSEPRGRHLLLPLRRRHRFPWTGAAPLPCEMPEHLALFLGWPWCSHRVEVRSHSKLVRLEILFYSGYQVRVRMSRFKSTFIINRSTCWTNLRLFWLAKNSTRWHNFCFRKKNNAKACCDSWTVFNFPWDVEEMVRESTEEVIFQVKSAGFCILLQWLSPYLF